MKIEINIPTGHRYWMHVALIGLIVGLSIQFARAWAEPASAPPGNYIAAPINVSINSQIKTGGLGINGPFHAYSSALIDGKVGIGTTTPAQQLSVAGTIESTAGGFKFPDGTTQATASGTASSGYTFKVTGYTELCQGIGKYNSVTGKFSGEVILNVDGNGVSVDGRRRMNGVAWCGSDSLCTHNNITYYTANGGIQAGYGIAARVANLPVNTVTTLW